MQRAIRTGDCFNLNFARLDCEFADSSLDNIMTTPKNR